MSVWEGKKESKLGNQEREKRIDKVGGKRKNGCPVRGKGGKDNTSDWVMEKEQNISMRKEEKEQK
jgi:hypothetical protein